MSRLPHLLRLWALLLLAACQPLLAPDQAATDAPAKPRAIVVGLPWVDLALAMGAGPQLVATDYSSRQLPAAARLPQVGFLRALRAGQMAALHPTLVVLSADAGPRAQLNRLRAHGIQFLQLERPVSRKDFFAQLRRLAQALHCVPAADSLVAAMQADFAQVDSLVARSSIRPQVLVLHAADMDALLLHGRGAPVAFLLTQVGALNAAEDTGMKIIGPKDPLPDAAFLLVEDSTLARLGGATQLKTHKRLRSLRAVQKGKVLGIPARQLYGPGPDAARFCLQFARQLHGLREE
jgi:iron complex transport system substrate-binding protein